MPSAELCVGRLRDTLSGRSVEHALEVLASATSATVALFNSEGQLAVGPVAGSSFVRTLLSTEAGQEAVVAAHKAAMDEGQSAPAARAGPQPILTDGSLDHFAIPVVAAGMRAGTLTLGDRPRRVLSTEVVDRIASSLGLDARLLQEAAAELQPWSPESAAADRNMAALLAELFAGLCAQDRALRLRIEELSAVYNIASMLAGTRDLQDILKKTARIVCDVMKVKACSIRMLDEATGVLTIKAVHNLSQEYITKGPVTIEQNPIDAEAIQGRIVRIADAPNDPRTRYPDQAKREGIVSGLVCGLVYRGKAVGVIRVYTGEPHVFSPFEESLLLAVASQAAAAIANAQLLSEMIEAERYARQIAYAGEVQRRMIPANPPKLDKIDIGAVYRPTFDVGGDYYDFISLPKGNMGVGVADVAGKGVPASLLMASMRSALRVYAYFTYDVDRIISEVNRHVCRETSTGEFITLFYGVLTPDGRRLTYCNAGHDPPMLLRDGRLLRLHAGGTILGIDPSATFDRGLVHLQPGDILLMYTDGAVEALNFADEQFGRERLAASLKSHADQPAQLIATHILWDLRRFRGLADRTDDVTLVAIKIK